MNEGDITKIDLLVKYDGNNKSKKAWERIKKFMESTNELQSCEHIGKPFSDENGVILCSRCGGEWEV